jgi:hypothetical protein
MRRYTLSKLFTLVVICSLVAALVERDWRARKLRAENDRLATDAARFALLWVGSSRIPKEEKLEIVHRFVRVGMLQKDVEKFAGDEVGSSLLGVLTIEYATGIEVKYAHGRVLHVDLFLP